MSQLQLALIAVAALVLVALFVAEKWQQRARMRRIQAQTQLSDTDAHVRIEPTLNEQSVAESFQGAMGALENPVESVAATSQEVSLEPPHDALTPQDQSDLDRDRDSFEDQTANLAPLAPGWVEDPYLDCALEIRCARATDGIRLIDAAAQLSAASWSVPVHFVVWDINTRQWVLPDRFGYYSDALAAIQLANRHGRVDANELRRFVTTLVGIADSLNADFDRPDIEAMAAQAQKVDELCARFDMRLGLTVLSNTGNWASLQIRQVAQNAGFVVQSPNLWAWQGVDSSGQPQIVNGYSLRFDSQQPDRLRLEFDVAAIANTIEIFRNLVDTTRLMAKRLDARVVDDNGNPIEERAFQAIEAQLVKVVDDMRQAGLEPGGSRAQRLYASS